MIITNYQGSIKRKCPEAKEEILPMERCDQIPTGINTKKAHIEKNLTDISELQTERDKS